jgi:DNA ligase (NAD+)
MPDSEYDRLLRELSELEARHPERFDPNSPTQRVGGAPIEGFRTVAHAVAMLSIDNTYDLDDLRAWHERVVKGLELEATAADSLAYVCDPKIDGVAVSLRYEAGELAVAVTRGDGRRGDDVTAQIRAIRSVPLRLLAAVGADAPPRLLEVRGEVFMPNSEFERINRERLAEGEVVFANARNATAGTLKNLDPAVAGARKLRFVAHGRGQIEGLRVGSHWDLLDAIRALGIPVGTLARRCAGIERVREAIEEFRGRRGGLEYGVDGMVVRVDRFDLQDALGATSKAPRWCIAFKYPAEQGTTRLLRVDWLVGKGGTLTPRATMEPIFLAGTTVQHATLHNIEEIRRKDIRVGDRVVIEKAGEIIPQVVGVAPEERPAASAPIEAPRACPACGGVVEQEGPKAYCVNPECPAQFREKLKWFVGRGQMDIDGMGEKLVDQLVDAGLVRHFADVFTLRREDLLELPRLGPKSVDNLLAAIAEARGRGLERVLVGLGIRHIGAAAARTLAARFRSAAQLSAASVEQIRLLPDFGPITAAALHEHLRSPQSAMTFERLEQAGVDLESHSAGPGAGPSPLQGKTVVLTGSLRTIGRQQLTELLISMGAQVSGSVSKKTDLVVVGDSPGSKARKARDLNLETWDEERLLEVLRDAGVAVEGPARGSG